MVENWNIGTDGFNENDMNYYHIQISLNYNIHA